MKKILVCILVGSLLSLSFALAGCEKVSNTSDDTENVSIDEIQDCEDGEIVQEDAPWFDVDKTELTEGKNAQLLLLDDGSFLSLQTDIKDKNRNLVFYSSDLKVENQIPVSNTLIDDSGEERQCDVMEIERHGDFYFLKKTVVYSANKQEVYGIDVVNKTIDDEPVSVENPYLYGVAIDSENILKPYFNTSNLYVGDYLVSTFNDDWNASISCIGIANKNNEVDFISSYDIFRPYNNGSLDEFMLPISETEILMRLKEDVNYTIKYEYFIFDLNQKQVRPYEMNDEFKSYLDAIETSLSMCRNAKNTNIDENVKIDSNGNVFFKWKSKICKLNFEAKRAEEIADFFDSDEDLSKIIDTKLLGINGDKYLFLNVCYNPYAEKINCEINTFTKAKVNPHAGKKLIKAVSPMSEYLETSLLSAIKKFNDEQDDFFIKYDSGYMSDVLVNNTSEEKFSINERLEKFSEKLSSDVAEDNAPDIVFNAYMDNSLDSKDCLVDLSPYYSKLDADDYFDNIIEASRTDDKLYQMPVLFGLDGIVAPPVTLSKKSIGFDFPSYRKFVRQKSAEDIGNSHNNLYDGQNSENDYDMIGTQYGVVDEDEFRTLIMAMENSIIDGNHLNINNDEFETIVDFIKEGVKIENVYPNSKEMIYRFNDVSALLLIGLANQFNCNVKLFGLPAASEHLPTVNVRDSVAITTSSKYKNTIWKFIQNMMDDDLEDEISIHINRKTQKEVDDKCMEDVSMALSKEDINDIFDQFYDMLDSVKVVERINIPIYNVINEEFMPYFQKHDVSYKDIVERVTDKCDDMLEQ